MILSVTQAIKDKRVTKYTRQIYMLLTLKANK